MNIFHLTARIVMAAILGIIIALSFAQEDPWFKSFLQHKVEEIISKAIDAPFSCRVKKINISMKFQLNIIHFLLRVKLKYSHRISSSCMDRL